MLTGYQREQIGCAVVMLLGALSVLGAVWIAYELIGPALRDERTYEPP